MINIEKEVYIQQKNEITEHYIYKKLAENCKNEENKNILLSISEDELRHYKYWEKITKKEMKPDMIRVYKYYLITKIFGLTFGLRYMEKGEESAQKFYDKASEKYKDVCKIKKDEEEHEQKLIGILNDKRLDYASSIVLGLNDALVELTGTLAGLTLAFRDSKLIGITGLIMGIAASMSMAASGYLSSREENNIEEKNPITSAIYTGVAYIITVILLIMPYFLINNVYISLGTMLVITILIIMGYTFYMSVAKNYKFHQRFLEMVLISLGVALISFAIGYVVKIYFGIEV